MPFLCACRANQRVAELVAAGEREAALVLIAIDVVGLDGVEHLACASRDPRLHDRAEDSDPADVQPSLAGPPVEGTAEHRVGELVLVAAEALPRAGVHVTDDVAAQVV
jgi:hypothetical protein